MRVLNHVVAASLLTLACRAKSAQPSASEASSGAEPEAARAAAQCVESRAPRFRVAAEPAQETPTSEEADDEFGAELPFSIEIGAAARLGEGYAVSYTSKDRAKLVLLSPELVAKDVIDLGPVSGQSPPPEVATVGDGLTIVIPTHDDRGGAFRLLYWSRATGLIEGALIHEGRDESRAFSMRVRDGSVLLVWDEALDVRADHQPGLTGNRSLIRGVRFPGAMPSVLAPSTNLTGEIDAESPRLADRPGGYWLGWLANDSAATNAAEPASEDSQRVVVEGSAFIEIAPLDELGHRAGEAIRVGNPLGEVAGFDLLGDGEGGAWVALRDQLTLPGVEGGELELLHVAPNGKIERFAVPSGELGPGAPSFLVDAADARAMARTAWVGVAGKDEALRLRSVTEMVARGTGGALGIPVPEAAPPGDAAAALGEATPLLRLAERVLLARPRGRDRELFFAVCPF